MPSLHVGTTPTDRGLGVSECSEPLKIFPCKPLPPDLISRVEKDHSGGFYGYFDAESLATRAAILIGSYSDAIKETLMEVMHDFLESCQEDHMAESMKAGVPVSLSSLSCWLCIRMTLPTVYWTIPR